MADISKDITIVRDDATREVFLSRMETWCQDNGYDCSVAPDGSLHKPNNLTLVYISFWSWDITTYIADATIKAYKDSKRIGEATFKASNNFNGAKWGDDEKRIGILMQLLFGQVTQEEANQMLAAGQL